MENIKFRNFNSILFAFVYLFLFLQTTYTFKNIPIFRYAYFFLVIAICPYILNVKYLCKSGKLTLGILVLSVILLFSSYINHVIYLHDIGIGCLFSPILGLLLINSRKNFITNCYFQKMINFYVIILTMHIVCCLLGFCQFAPSVFPFLNWLFENPNAFAIHLYSLFMLEMMFEPRKRINRILCVILFFMILFTFSRTCIFASFILFFLKKLNLRKHKLVMLLIGIIVAVSFFGLSGIIPQKVGLSNRDIAWKTTINNYILKSDNQFFWGNGNLFYVVKELNYSCHNSFLTFACKFGVISLIIFLITWFCSIKLKTRHNLVLTSSILFVSIFESDSFTNLEMIPWLTYVICVNTQNFTNCSKVIYD